MKGKTSLSRGKMWTTIGSVCATLKWMAVRSRGRRTPTSSTCLVSPVPLMSSLSHLAQSMITNHG